MKSIIGLSIVVAALIVVAQSTTYPSSFGSFEGTTVRFWDFGATTFGQSAIGQTYSINVLVNGTLTPASNDGSTGEYQPLLCANVSCPIIFANTASASLFYAGTANLDTPLALPNTSYTANSTLSNVHQLSQGSISYRRVVTESDSLDVGGDATQGWFNGNPVYFFDFGNDGNIAAPAIFIIGNSTKNVTIFSSQSTHFVTKTIVTPPADSKVNLDDIDRVSDIPAAWLSNSTLTTVGTTVYELGFIRVAGTPPPQAAASIAMPSIAALLFAALLAILL